MAKKSGKNVYLVALLLFLGGVGYLAYSGFSENSVYFLNGYLQGRCGSHCGRGAPA